MSGSGISSFDAQTRAFRLAREVLALHLASRRRTDRSETEVLTREVLPAVERISRGVGLTARAQRLDSATTRDLLAREGLLSSFAPPTDEADRVAAERERETLARDGRRRIDLTAGHALAAANHAELVFALIPRLPADLVTWPRFRLGNGYADVLAPHGVGEVLERVEEMETVLWRTAAGRDVEADERVRRTYAFCETACWLDLRLAAG
jgi:hypothetical protein